jgi:hypothetical protein
MTCWAPARAAQNCGRGTELGATLPGCSMCSSRLNPALGALCALLGQLPSERLAIDTQR